MLNVTEETGLRADALHLPKIFALRLFRIAFESLRYGSSVKMAP